MEDTELFYDSLSDVPSDYDGSDSSDADNDEREDVTYDPNLKSTPRIAFISSAAEDTDDVEIEDWSEFDTPRSADAFSGDFGPKAFPANCASVDDVTSLFMGDDLFQMLVEETNRYHDQCNVRTASKSAKWQDVTTDDLKKFFALLIIMTQVRKSKLADYWSKNTLVETPIFSRTMSRDRFSNILIFLHFQDNSKQCESKERLFKVQRVIDYFLEKFQTVYKPKRDVIIDDGIISWRGSGNFKIKTTGHQRKSGILARMLCEAGTGYVFNLCLDTDNDHDPETVIRTLLSSRSGLGHHIYVNKFYTSVSIAESLLKNNTRICGYVNKNKGFPDSVHSLNLQQLEGKHVWKGEVLAQLWRDGGGKDVRIISTVHNSDTIKINKRNCRTGESVKKPKSLIDLQRYFNQNTLGQRITLYPLLRKSKKWTKKVVLFMVNCALSNSLVVYNALNSKTMKYDDFVLKVAHSWLEGREVVVKIEKMDEEDDKIEEKDEKHKISASVMRTRFSAKSRIFDPPGRLVGDMRVHKVDRFVGVGVKGTKVSRKRCRVCMAQGKRRDTLFMCVSCKVPLHPGTCFEDYHTKKVY